MNRIIKRLGPVMRKTFKSKRQNSVQTAHFKNSASSVIVLLVALLAVLLPKAELLQAQECSAHVRGNITDEEKGTFESNSSGNDFSITCTGSSNLQFADSLIQSIVNSAGYSTGESNRSKFVLEITGASLTGNVLFVDDVHNDVLNIKHSGSGSIKGDVSFFGGTDVMNINIASGQNFVIDGEISGLETLTTTGAGYLRLAKDVDLSTASANEGLRIQSGYLVIAGTLNLGSSGTLTINQAGKLMFELTAINDGTIEHGNIEGGTINFPDDKRVIYVQLKNDQVKDAVVQDLTGNTSLALFVNSSFDNTDTINVVSKSKEGEDVKVGDLSAAGELTIDAADAEKIFTLHLPSVSAATANSGSDSNSAGAILGLGLLAVLLSSFTGDDSSASFGDYYFNTPQTAYIASINERGVMTIKETGNQPYQMWIRTGHTAQPMRMTGVSNSGVSGTEVGVNLYDSDTFYINTSVAPNVAAEVGSLNLAAKGEVYSLSSGWRNDRYFGGLRLSHGEFEVNSIVDNPIVNSALISNAKLRNTQAQLRAGMNLGTGALRFTPSASIQVGTYENSEHVAESPALEATIPSYAQDYTSVQLGLKMTSEKWLSLTNGSKWKPQLKFDSIHTNSKDTGILTLRQSDKLGVLSFNTNAGLRSMPDVVNSMSFGAKVKSSTNDQAEWKFGFAGLEADGEEYYAAMAAYQLRF